VGRWLLFASSYCPLFLLASIRSQDDQLRRGLGIAALLAAASLLIVVVAARRIQPRQRTVVAREDRGPDVAGYLATYLLPLLAAPDPSGHDLIAYGGYILLVGLVYVRSSMVAINPLAYLIGYRLTEVSTAAGDRQMLLSRQVPPTGHTILVRRVLPGLLISTNADLAATEDE
jgi:hypothetical protein